MPLYWTIDSTQQLVTVTAEGKVARADVDECLDAVAGGRAMAYRKLFDGRAGSIEMAPEDLMAIAARFRSFHGSPVGALAILLSQDKSEQVGRLLGILAAADRPIRLFASLPPAQRWIESLGPSPFGQDTSP